MQKTLQPTLFIILIFISGITTLFAENSEDDIDSPDTNGFFASSYIMIDGGYNLSGSQQLLSIRQSLIGISGQYGTLSQGMEVNLTFGHWFHENIGFIFGTGFLSGNQSEGIPFVGMAPIFPMEQGDGNISLNSFHFKPGLQFGFSLSSVIDQYTNLGMKIAAPSAESKIVQEVASPWDPSTRTEGEFEFNRKLTPGFFIETGLKFQLTENFSVRSGLYLSALSYVPDEVKLKRLFEDGEEITHQIDEEDRTIELKSSLNLQNFEDNATFVAPMDMSAFSVRIGAVYDF